MSLPVMLMNPPKKKGAKAKKVATKKKNPKRVAAGKKAARARKYALKAAQGAAKPTKRKKASSKKKRATKQRNIFVRVGRAIKKIPTRGGVYSNIKPKVRRLKRKSVMKSSKAFKALLRKGRSVKLKKGKRSIMPAKYKINGRRRKHHAKRNPQFNMKKIASFAGGAVAAIVVHKMGVQMLGNLLAKLPMIGQYAEKINTNKWVNLASKGALAAIVYKVGSKKSEVIRNASKAYAGTAIALVIMQAVGVDQKLMLAQSGLGEMEGIEMNGYEMGGIEMNGIEMNGIESLGETDGYEMGEVDGDGDGLNGNEGVY